MISPKEKTQPSMMEADHWEGRSFEFTVHIHNDTLVQRGVEKLPDLGVDRYIIEEYVRVK